MHPKIETTETHEVRHLHVVDRRTMVPIFVRYHELTLFRRIPFPSGRARGVENRHSIFKKSYALRSERNLDTQLVRGRSPAEEDLCAPPMTRLSSNVEREHFVAYRRTLSIGACVEQSPQIILLPETCSQHQHRHIFVFLDVTLEC